MTLSLAKMDQQAVDDAIRAIKATMGLEIRVVWNAAHTTDARRVLLLLRIGELDVPLYGILHSPRALKSANAKSPEDIPWLVIADRLTESERKAYEKKGIGYVATSDQEWYLPLTLTSRMSPSLDPRPRPKETGEPRASRNRGGLEALLFCLLSKPKALASPQRTIALEAGVSTVTVNRWLQELTDRRTLRRTNDGYKFVDAGDALVEWFSLHRHRRHALYHTERFAAEFPKIMSLLMGSAAEGAYLSGAQAADSLTHNIRSSTVLAYCDPESRRAAIRSLRLTPNQGGSFSLRPVYWTFKGWEGEDRKLAPLPLIYADLRSDDDPRIQESAMTVLDEVVKRHEN